MGRTDKQRAPSASPTSFCCLPAVGLRISCRRVGSSGPQYVWMSSHRFWHEFNEISAYKRGSGPNSIRFTLLQSLFSIIAKHIFELNFVASKFHAWRPVDPQTSFFGGFETPEQTPCERSEGGKSGRRWGCMCGGVSCMCVIPRV